MEWLVLREARSVFLLGDRNTYIEMALLFIYDVMTLLALVQIHNTQTNNRNGYIKNVVTKPDKYSEMFTFPFYRNMATKMSNSSGKNVIHCQS